MPVLTIINPKGGSGKTTLALVLASSYAAQGHRIALLDADINQPLKDWLTGGVEAFRIVSDLNDDNILEVIDRESTRSDLVIVDNEGVQSVMSGFAVTRADLVLVPMNASYLDAREAARAMRLVKLQESASKRRIAARALLSRTSDAIKRKRGREIAAELAESGIGMLSSSLRDRVAFEAMFKFRTTLEHLPGDIPGIDKAKADARALASEVETVLRTIAQERRAA